MQIDQQPKQGSFILKRISNFENVSLLNILIGFIDLQILEIIGEAAIQYHKNQKFYKLVIATLFMKKYTNRVDRSLFFLFYEDPEFQSIEKNTISKLAAQKQQFFRDSYRSYKQILNAIQYESSCIQNPKQFREFIESCFFEPDLPLPKMKRQTVAMYCESSFQQMMALIRIPPQVLEQEQWLQYPLMELRQKLAQEIQIYDQQKMQAVRFCGNLTCQDWKKWIIKGYRTHNLIVLLLVLADRIAYTFQTLINSMDDPFMKFIEFNLRSSIFRNSILLIEEKLHFIFEKYERFYQKYHYSSTHPKMNFWRPAFSIWIQRMKQFHQPNLKMLNYISSKLREEHMREFLKVKIEKLPSYYSYLKDQIESNTYSNNKMEEAYQENNQKVEVEQFFQNNYQMYEILAKQYLEYMVDISMNQYNVHWCGHSLHSITCNPLFKEFSNSLSSQSLAFYKYIKSILSKNIEKDILLSIFRQVVKEDLSYIDNKIAKPVTVRQSLDLLNVLIKQQVQSMKQYIIFTGQGMAKYKLSIDFDEKDNLISYFASKSQIPQNCPKDKQFFYNTQIDCPPNWKALIHAKDEEDESDGEIEQNAYLSQQES